MKFHKKTNRKQDFRKGKGPEYTFKEKDKGFSKGNKIECFNCGGLFLDRPSPKISKSLCRQPRVTQT